MSGICGPQAVRCVVFFHRGDLAEVTVNRPFEVIWMLLTCGIADLQLSLWKDGTIDGLIECQIYRVRPVIATHRTLMVLLICLPLDEAVDNVDENTGRSFWIPLQMKMLKRFL